MINRNSTKNFMNMNGLDQSIKINFNCLVKEQKRVAEQQNKIISIDLNHISPSSLQTIQNLRNVLSHSQIENTNSIRTKSNI